MKLLDQVRGVLRAKHYAFRTEKCYIHWIIRYIHFHGVKHPNTLATREIEQFLTHLATHDKVAASTQNQARGALLFLYRDVLKIEVGDLDAVRARRPVRVPTVMTREETRQLLDALAQLDTREPYEVMAQLMYGSGLRLMECCRLRVKDVDLGRGQLTVRSGKGDKDRYVMLPDSARAAIAKLLERRRICMSATWRAVKAASKCPLRSTSARRWMASSLLR